MYDGTVCELGMPSNQSRVDALLSMGSNACSREEEAREGDADPRDGRVYALDASAGSSTTGFDPKSACATRWRNQGMTEPEARAGPHGSAASRRQRGHGSAHRERAPLAVASENVSPSDQSITWNATRPTS